MVQVANGKWQMVAAGTRARLLIIPLLLHQLLHHTDQNFPTTAHQPSAMAQEAAFPNKEIRKKCWDARDSLWKCLDDNNDDEKLCSNFQTQLKASCPQQWVRPAALHRLQSTDLSHFPSSLQVDYYGRRRKYLKFKAKIESGTYDPVEESAKK